MILKSSSVTTNCVGLVLSSQGNHGNEIKKSLRDKAAAVHKNQSL